MFVEIVCPEFEYRQMKNNRSEFNRERNKTFSIYVAVLSMKNRIAIKIKAAASQHCIRVRVLS